MKKLFLLVSSFKENICCCTDIFRIYHFMPFEPVIFLSSNFFSLSLPSFWGKEGRLGGRLNHFFIKPYKSHIKIFLLTFVNFSFWFLKHWIEIKNYGSSFWRKKRKSLLWKSPQIISGRSFCFPQKTLLLHPNIQRHLRASKPHEKMLTALRILSL